MEIKIFNWFNKKINLETLTEKDIATLHHSKLYELALKYNPGNKEKIENAYNFLKDLGDSSSARTIFIGHHIKPYLKNTNNSL